MVRRLWIVLRLEEVVIKQSSLVSMTLKEYRIVRVEVELSRVVVLQIVIMFLRGFIKILERRRHLGQLRMLTLVREVKVR